VRIKLIATQFFEDFLAFFALYIKRYIYPQTKKDEGQQCFADKVEQILHINQKLERPQLFTSCKVGRKVIK